MRGIITQTQDPGMSLHVNVSPKKLLKKLFQYNRIGGIMVAVLASSAVDHGVETRSRQTKDCKLVFVASPLSMQH